MSRLSYDGGCLTGATVVDADGIESQVEADYYILAVPFERAAPLMTDEMVAADPALGRIKDLEGIWTSGLMLYLTEPVPELSVASMSFGPKRRPGVDEPFWELAPINWTRTWSWGDDFSQRYGDGGAATYLPIEVGSSSWTDLPGKLYGKPMSQCTEGELQAEVLDLLRRTYPDGHRIFADSRIHSFRVTDGIRRQGGRWVNDNAVCFAPSPGCWENQPEVNTNIPNLFLAGGHVRSTTGWDNMDAANETGKQAAAAVIAATGVNAPVIPVAEWTPPLELKPFMALDNLLYRMGRPNVFDIVAPSRPQRGGIVPAETGNETAPGWTEWVGSATESESHAAGSEASI
ncbi:amine oxidase [Mycobacteroides abscessus subsp. abscessus]|nr:amine oxidase [Mycobacteroides abscessus subsp. abscessus]